MTRAPVIATAKAKATDTYPEGFCLRFVRELYGVAKVFDTATEAWEHTDHRHIDWPPPVGVPVWWTGGDGHVAISAGSGKVYTTDNPLEGPGEVGLCPIQTITTRWGKRYRGWSDDVNDVTVYQWSGLDLSQLRQAARVDPSSAATVRTYPAGTRLWEAALYLLGFLGRDWAFDGHYGKATINATSKYQQALGLPGSPAVPGSPADGVPGKISAAMLAQRFHWKVT